MIHRTAWLCGLLLLLSVSAEERVYENTLTPMKAPTPLLADHPEWITPIKEAQHFEAPAIVDEAGADLEVRAWRFSYNARGIIEMPNRLLSKHTALICVHPWGIDDGQGWRTPEPAGVADFCTPVKNALTHGHIEGVLNPFIQRMREHVALVLYSQPGKEDAIRKKLYRSFRHRPSKKERKEGARELHEKLNNFNYNAGPLSPTLTFNSTTPVVEYFKQFPGLDAGEHYNGKGFWDLPIPVIRGIETRPNDVMIYDGEGYDPLREFLKAQGIRHVLLTGYCADMCFKATTAGYENLSKDFDVFLVGDATLATFPSNETPAHATNAAISFAALNQLVTQISWVQPIGKEQK